jgi:hypothetical protein
VRGLARTEASRSLLLPTSLEAVFFSDGQSGPPLPRRPLFLCNRRTRVTKGDDGCPMLR